MNSRNHHLQLLMKKILTILILNLMKSLNLHLHQSLNLLLCLYLMLNQMLNQMLNLNLMILNLSQTLNLRLVFSFEGLLLASVLVNLPFMVQPIQRGFEAIPGDIRDAASCCGLTPWQCFRRIELPLALSEAGAAQIAARLLYESWIARTRIA